MFMGFVEFIELKRIKVKGERSKEKGERSKEKGKRLADKAERPKYTV
jgi:hypothetical protein